MRVAYWGNHSVSFSTESHVAASFELLGHEVTRIQEGEVKAVDVPDIASGHDFLIWQQTYGLAVTGGTLEERANALQRIKSKGIPTVAYHLDLWMGLEREHQVREEPFFRCDYVFTADGGHDREWKRLGINHIWLPPGVFEPECAGGRFNRRYASDIAFVGSWLGHYHKESTHRFELVEFLQRNYHRKVRFWPQPGRPAVRGRELMDLYASVKVVVGDSCLVPNAPRYWSDRIPEVIGRGGFLLHPWVEGLDEHFTDGKHLVTWPAGDWDELKRLIDYYIVNDQERMDIAREGREHVLKYHTYTVRAQQIIDHLGL